MISDRDKGLKEAIKKWFPNAAVGHCCQHIADNIQAYHGAAKFREKLWRAARAKTEEFFKGSNFFLLLLTEPKIVLIAVA
jgi:transposase-like protein